MLKERELIMLDTLFTKLFETCTTVDDLEIVNDQVYGIRDVCYETRLRKLKEVKENEKN